MQCPKQGATQDMAAGAWCTRDLESGEDERDKQAATQPCRAWDNVALVPRTVGTPEDCMLLEECVVWDSKKEHGCVLGT